MTALRSRHRARLCLEACRGIPDAALEAGGVQLALRVARAALGLAPSLASVDLDLLRRTVEAPSLTEPTTAPSPVPEDDHE